VPDGGGPTSEACVEIAVRDEGPGMAPEVLARACEPFFTTKPQGIGTGLGLSMVQGFARQSGGDLLIDSAPGAGTTVRLLLPMAMDAEPAPPPVAPATAWRGGTLRTLLVEDQPDVRASALRLCRDLGLDPVGVADAEEALGLLAAATAPGGARFDLLFTDIVLSGRLDGIDLAERAVRFAPEIRVLFATGYAGDSVIPNGRLGADKVLVQKPYRRGDLLAALGRLFAGADRPPGEADA